MPDRKLDNGYQTSHHEDPSSANLWSTYLLKSEKDDKAMAQNWKGDMDAILIFAGLFSASLTAFIMESYKSLKPDPTNTSILLLARISSQLASLSNDTLSSSTDLLDMQNQGFSPPLSAIICNVLWFLSLAFSLTSALSATLVEQWTRRYLQATSNRPAPQDRARLSAYLYQGIKKYKMNAIVETIPMLLHTSLFLFLAGLIAFLVPINAGLGYLMSVLLVGCCTLYTLISIVPVFQHCCPYWTPVSTLFWILMQKMHLLYRRDADGNKVEITTHMSEARQVDAMDITPERDQRDLKAMCWTINSLRRYAEFELFLESLPPVISGMDYSAKRLVHDLTKHNDISINLGYRIPKLLSTCDPMHLNPSIAHKRAVVCLKAMWSLAMLSIPKTTPTALNQFRQHLVFKEDTLVFLHNASTSVAAVYEYVLSTSVVVSRSLLDMQLDRSRALEATLLHVLDSGQWESPAHEISYTHLQSHCKSPIDLITASEIRSQALTEYLSQPKSIRTPLPHVMIEDIANHHLRLFATARTSPFVNMDVIRENLRLEKSFQSYLNQAGFNLALEYIGNIMDSDTLPHEVFNTLRRAFIRIDSQVRVNEESQERLIKYLEEAVELTATWSTRLPQGIIDILLNLTRSLTETNLILKAVNVIGKYQKTTRDDAAQKALFDLERRLPRDSRASPTLDLYSSHVFIDAKPYRQQNKW